MRDIFADLRYAARALLARRAFALASIATLALGIGMTTAIFSVVRGVVLRPLPLRAADRLISVCELHEGSTRDWCSIAPPNVEDIARRTRAIEAIGVARSWSVTLSGVDGAENIEAGIATPGMFDALGIRAQRGRLIERGDVTGEPGRVAVLSHELWQSRFAGAADIVGRALTIDGAPVTVVGILEPDMRVPLFERARLWRPVHIDPTAERHREWRGFVSYARLRAGASIDDARAELSAIEGDLRARHFANTAGWALEPRPLLDLVVGNVEGPMRMFLGAVILVLLIACANVANLLLARGMARSHELAVRAALGASRGRIARVMLLESLLLAVLGAAAGLLLAEWTTAAFKALAPEGIPRIELVRTDGAVLAFAVAAAIVTAFLVGLVPAWRLSRPELVQALRDGGRGASGRSRFGRLLVVGELAIALPLVTGAVLLTQSFQRLTSWDPGFERDRLGVFSMFLPATTIPPRGRVAVAEAWDRLEREIASLPGVTAVGTASAGPLFGGDESWEMIVEGRSPDDRQSIRWYDVSPGFFRALGVPIVQGRDLAPTDRFGAPSVAVVNETLARRYWPGANPVGKHVTFPYGDQQETYEIVGVVADVPPLRPGTPVRPELYWSNRQAPRVFTYFVVRSDVPPATLASAIAARVKSVHRDYTADGFTTYAEMLKRHVRAPRFNMTLLLTFGLVAIALAAIGTYGLLAYVVEQRTRDIGIRIALGAARERVLAQVVRSAATMAAIGVGVGAVLSLALGRVLAGVMAGVPARDPLLLAGSATIVMLVALASSLVPAWRASRVDPARALTSD